MKKNNIPIVCDLDGTLIKSDLFIESLLIYIKLNFYHIFIAIYKLITQRIAFKNYITHSFKPNAKNIPFNTELISWLKKQKQEGREIYLVTGSTKSSVALIKSKLTIFSNIYNSSQNQNLVGSEKAKFLIEKFGREKFDYIGNSITDFKVWKYAREKILVNNIYLQLIFRNFFNKIFKKDKGYLKNLSFFLRIHQWSKNGLIFLHPLIVFQSLDIPIFLNYFIFFVVFSITASFVYVLNDIIDLAHDREHAQKKHRPLASGFFDIKESVFLLLLLSFLILCFVLNSSLVLIYILLTYLVLNIIYSMYLKKIKYIDIFALSIFFNIRIFSGIEIDPNSIISKRFLLFTLLIFFSLGSLKRIVELINQPNIKNSGRAYIAEDKRNLKVIGLGALLISFILIIDSYKYLQIASHFNFSTFLSLLGLIYIWLIYLWYSGFMRRFVNDPVVFAMKNSISLFLIFLIVNVVLFV
jgi:4-hydroxybenzoate polyprenyltransferase